MTPTAPKVVLLSKEEMGTGAVPCEGAAPWSLVLRKRNRCTEGSQGVHMALSEGFSRETVNQVHRKVGAGGGGFLAKRTASTGMNC